MLITIEEESGPANIVVWPSHAEANAANPTEEGRRSQICGCAIAAIHPISGSYPPLREVEISARRPAEPCSQHLWRHSRRRPWRLRHPARPATPESRWRVRAARRCRWVSFATGSPSDSHNVFHRPRDPGTIRARQKNGDLSDRHRCAIIHHGTSLASLAGLQISFDRLPQGIHDVDDV